MREITLGLIGTGFMGKCLTPGEPRFRWVSEFPGTAGAALGRQDPA
jgi:hypothetical protein